MNDYIEQGQRILDSVMNQPDLLKRCIGGLLIILGLRLSAHAITSLKTILGVFIMLGGQISKIGLERRTIKNEAKRKASEMMYKGNRVAEINKWAKVIEVPPSDGGYDYVSASFPQRGLLVGDYIYVGGINNKDAFYVNCKGDRKKIPISFLALAD